MKDYFLTTRANKMELINSIIVSEDLDATAKIEKDANGQSWIAVTTTEEEYQTLKSIFRMVDGGNT